MLKQGNLGIYKKPILALLQSVREEAKKYQN